MVFNNDCDIYRVWGFSDSKRWMKLKNFLLNRKVKLSELRNVISVEDYHCIGTGEMISRDSLMRICEFLNCKIVDIVDLDLPIYSTNVERFDERADEQNFASADCH